MLPRSDRFVKQDDLPFERIELWNHTIDLLRHPHQDHGLHSESGMCQPEPEPDVPPFLEVVPRLVRGGRTQLPQEDLMKPDLISEIALLVGGVLLFAPLLLVILALTRV